MATLAQQPPVTTSGDERFFLRAAVVMTITIISGFSFQYLMGRSTFASPIRVHLHAFFFMGWVGIYLFQNIFVATGRMHLHRRLGWIAAFWIIPMVIMGCYVTAVMVRNGTVPFFFRPQQFLVFDPLTVLTFAGLTVAAVALRKRTQWHRRLHYCGMSLLLGPAFGRLLPLPLLQPWAWEGGLRRLPAVPGCRRGRRHSPQRAHSSGVELGHGNDGRSLRAHRDRHLQPGRTIDLPGSDQRFARRGDRAARFCPASGRAADDRAEMTARFAC
jgi:hypothetical protein